MGRGGLPGRRSSKASPKTIANPRKPSDPAVAIPDEIPDQHDDPNFPTYRNMLRALGSDLNMPVEVHRTHLPLDDFEPDWSIHSLHFATDGTMTSFLRTRERPTSVLSSISAEDVVVVVKRVNVDPSKPNSTTYKSFLLVNWKYNM